MQDVLAKQERLQEALNDPTHGSLIDEAQRRMEEGSVEGLRRRLEEVSPEGVRRRMEEAARLGEPLDLVRHANGIRLAIEEADRVLGPEGIEAALRLELPRLDAAQELQRARERIRGDGVAKILGEASALADSSWIREVIRQADTDELIRRAAELSVTEGPGVTRAFGLGPDTTLAPEVVVMTKEQLRDFLHCAQQLVLVLAAVLSVGSLSGYNLTTARDMAATLCFLLAIASAQLKRKDERES